MEKKIYPLKLTPKTYLSVDSDSVNKAVEI